MRTIADVLARLQAEQASLPPARAAADSVTALANQKLRDDLENQIKAASDELIKSRAAEDEAYSEDIAAIQAAIAELPAPTVVVAVNQAAATA